MKRIIFTSSVLALVGLTLIGIRSDAVRRGSACCASVDVRITQLDESTYTFDFTNKAPKNVVAYTFTWNDGAGQYSTFLFGQPFSDTYSEKARLQRKAGDTRLALTSVAFDDGSYEGDEARSRWNILAIRAAEDEHQRLRPRIQGIIAGTVTTDTALSLMEPAPERNVRRVALGNPDEIARDFGANEARDMHRNALVAAQGDREQLKAQAEYLDKRFSIMRKAVR